MQAVMCTRYGPPEVLQLQEGDKPIPGDPDLSRPRIVETSIFDEAE
jgi:hypothetical protein